MIRAIAEQTNLLAPQRSHRGGAGRRHGQGFAVVADEVRRWHNKTRSSTDEIGQLIGSLQT